MISTYKVIVRIFSVCAVAVGTAALPFFVLAQTPNPAPNPTAEVPPSAPALRCSEQQQRTPITPALFHGKWQGTRAGKPISISLGNNADMPGSLEGAYQWNKKAIALAGDNDGLALTLEESDDNTRVSGVWELKLCSGVLRGRWVDPNYANEQAIDLRRASVAARKAP
jgi:hypothetical protein